MEKEIGIARHGEVPRPTPTARAEARQPRISVLMTSYNNACFLREQIDSILAQTWGNWDLTVSDNGSTDGSVDILRDYGSRHPDRVRLVRGPGGMHENHFTLVANADPASDYFGWCGSDDVWLPTKMEWAMEKVAELGQDRPVLYGGRVVTVDERNTGDAPYPLLNRLEPSFGNALVQCVTSGQTCVFNRPARELIALGLGHDWARGQWSYWDWWAYMIITGAGGVVIYDPRPAVRYRQHGDNAAGSNKGLKAKLARLRAVADGVFRESVDVNLAALSKCADRLTPGNRARLGAMERLHRGEGGPLKRVKLLREAGLCRQSRAQSAFLYVMALMKWL